MEDRIVEISPFDTLALAQALRDDAGFAQHQAEGTARALSRIVLPELATKSAIERTRLILQSDIEKFRIEINGDVAKFRTEMHAEIEKLRA